MTLDQYMTEFGLKGVDLAPRLGISEASLTRIRRGEQNITRDLIRRIVTETDGQVTAADLVFGTAADGFDPVHGREATPAGSACQ